MHIQIGKKYQVNMYLGRSETTSIQTVTVNEILFGRMTFKCTVHKTGQSYTLHESCFIKELK